jgi:hypothetical protein
MRNKIFLASLFVMLFLAACGADYYDRVISNRSSKNVTYTYDGKRETLGAGDSRTYSVTLAVHAPSSFSFDPELDHPKEVVMKPEGFDYIFENAPKIKLVVYNTLTTTNITISSEYIDANGTGGADNATSFEVDKVIDASTHTDSSTTYPNAVIYTRTPVFTVTSDDLPGYDFQVEYKIENISDTDTMGVTIR